MRLKYRPEIDGLRTIAVFSVILYHAEFIILGINPFKGGFLGVDVFFVISGYLITSLILREMQDDNFSLVRFYERRARRILPALFTVIAFSLPFAWVFMLPKAMKEYSGSVLSALLFSSNFWFWKEVSYTAEPSVLKPFLHTWSVSAEEQFYVIFPVVLIIVWKFSRNKLVPVFVLGFILSLLLAHYGSLKFRDASFYLLPTRGWELLAGAILAKLELDKGRSSHPFLDYTMPALGLLLILVSVVSFNDQMNLPSFMTGWPVLGTMLIIWFTKRGELVTNVLSSRLFVAVGLISYSLYLWHFPIFAFARIKSSSPSSDWDKVEHIALSLLMATITFFLIEKPTRTVQAISHRQFITATSTAFVILMASSGYVYYKNGIESRFPNLSALINLNYDFNDAFRTGTCFLVSADLDTDAEPDFSSCEVLQESDDKPNLLLWGDSFSAHLFSGYNVAFGKDYNIIQRSITSCLPIKNFGNKNCQKANNFIIDEISKLKPDKVVLAGAWHSYDWRLIHATIQYLQNLGIEDIDLVGVPPVWEGSLSKQLVRFMETHLNDQIPARLKNGLLEKPFVNDKEMREFSSQYGVEYLSPINILCNEGGCLTKVGSSPSAITAWDTVHLTELASEYVVSRFISKSPTPSD